MDTSSMLAYLSGEPGEDVDNLETVLAQKQAVLPPAVLAELLSDSRLSAALAQLFRELPLLPISEGYWERTGLLRAKLLAKGLRARLADALIAQSCIDHEAMLITRDADFRHFARLCGLKLA